MGQLPLERSLVGFGAGAVVDSGATVEGHYLEGLGFNYKPVRWVLGAGGRACALVSSSCGRWLMQIAARRLFMPAPLFSHFILTRAVALVAPCGPSPLHAVWASEAGCSTGRG